MEAEKSIQVPSDITVEQLVKLLNEIKLHEFGTNKHPITVKQLMHFSNAKLGDKRYTVFSIKKKSGGLREISKPCYQLKCILYVLNIFLRSLYTPRECVMGFTTGRSVVGNAAVHAAHHYVFNIDLKDFFPSIPQARVWARLQLKPFYFSKEVASIIAGLCCNRNSEGKNVLPQGAATSPLLTNAICDKLDRRMCGVAKRFGLHYSRYADDMTFSSMHNVYKDDSDFRKEIKRIIEDQGFTMNDKKTRLLRDGRRQEVTGLTVNSKVNVSRKYMQDLRWYISMWEKEGYAKAYSRFYISYKKEKGYIKKGEPVMENVIGGKLNYLRMVRGASDAAYQKLQQRFDKLQELVFVDNQTDKGAQFVYVQPYTYKEFTSLFNTDIQLEVSAGNKLVGKCTIDGIDKFISIVKAAQRQLCPTLDGRKAGDIVESSGLSKCYIALCRSKGKNFWLMSLKPLRRSKTLSIQNAKVNVDDLFALWNNEGFEKAAAAFDDFVNKSKAIPECKEKPKKEYLDGNNTLDIQSENNIVERSTSGRNFSEDDLLAAGADVDF